MLRKSVIIFKQHMGRTKLSLSIALPRTVKVLRIRGDGGKFSRELLFSSSSRKLAISSHLPDFFSSSLSHTTSSSSGSGSRVRNERVVAE